MQSIFITTPEVDSGRWLKAFPDAEVLAGQGLSRAHIDSNAVVWLLLTNNWSSRITSILATGASVVAMTLDESDTEARKAIAAGASAYIHALAALEMLLQVEQVVSHGGLWLKPSLLRQLMIQPKKPLAEASSRTVVLTTRERAVAIAVASGKTNKEVARELHITDRTVKAHLSACFDKLKVRDRVQLSLVMNR